MIIDSAKVQLNFKSPKNLDFIFLQIPVLFHTPTPPHIAINIKYGTAQSNNHPHSR